MSRWLMLFALCHLARYSPAAWTAALAPDTSKLAVPIEEALVNSRRGMPREIYHALTGRWR